MDIEVNRITIKNFKNLREVTIRPKKFNILIGPNGSGKTNFLEFFKLLRKIYVKRNPYPFLEWGGYENVVWNHQIGLPIEFEIETVERTNLTDFTKKYWLKEIKFEKDLSFEIFRRISASFWADKAENLKILKESAEIEVPKLNYRFSIEKSGDIWKIELNEKVYELSDKDVGIKSLHLEISGIIEDGLRFEDLGYIEDTINDFIIVGIWEELPENAEEDFVLKLERILSDMGVFPKEVVFTDFLSKPIPVSRIISDSLSLTIYQPLLALFKTTVLFPLNLTEIKYKRIIPREEPLSERGEKSWTF